MRGYVLLRDPAQLPAASAAVSNQFAVNDDGLLVWVGNSGSLSAPAWNTTSPTIGGNSYEWGMPIRLREDNNSFATRRIGSGMPDFKWGLTNQVNWKGLSLFALLDAQHGGNVYNATKQKMYQYSRHIENDQFDKPDNLKKPTTYYNMLYAAEDPIDWFVEDGSFVKLREMALRYSLGSDRFSFLRRVGSERLTLGLIGRNLYTWTDYTGIDPEVGSVLLREDDFGYPTYRTLTAMFEVVF
jgi:hypothetical protein